MAMRNTALLGQYAGFVTRAAALILDIVIITVAIVVINAVVALPLSFFLRVNMQVCVQNPQLYAGIEGLFCRIVGITWLLVTLLTGPIYFIFFFAVSGQTIGKYVMGVRIVRLDGRPMTFKTGLVRWFGYFISLIPLGLGFVWVVVNDRRLAFHDHMAKTCVVYSWRAYSSGYYLQRLNAWFTRRRKPGATATAGAVPMALHHYDLIALAVTSLVQAEALLGQINDLVARGPMRIELTGLLAKDAAGAVSVISFGEKSTPTSSGRILSGEHQLPADQREAIARDLPADSFIVAVLLLEEWADELVKQVSRRSSVIVRRYDLGTAPSAVLAAASPVAEAQSQSA